MFSPDITHAFGLGRKTEILETIYKGIGSKTKIKLEGGLGWYMTLDRVGPIDNKPSTN